MQSTQLSALVYTLLHLSVLLNKFFCIVSPYFLYREIENTVGAIDFSLPRHRNNALAQASAHNVHTGVDSVYAALMVVYVECIGVYTSYSIEYQ